MGKSDGLFNNNSLERMKLGMCDELSSVSFSDAFTSETGENEARVGFVDEENNIDSHSLKSRLRTSHKSGKPTNGCNSEVESLKSSDDSASDNIEPTHFDMPNLERSRYMDGCDICDQDVAIGEQKNDETRSISDHYSETSNDSTSSQVKCGVVISPVSLTQDLPVDVKSENKLSSVLENLPLVYIPTTHQLLAGNREESNCSKTNGFKNEDGQVKPSQSLSDIDSSQSTSTETILNCDYNDCEIIDDQFRSLNINLETSSLGETDSLLRLKEADQLTCHSFEIDTTLHRSNTGDSLLRTFNDASSLSSLSTCTEFSISAASIGEDGTEGTGLCIDTGDGGFMEINLHSRNSYERSKNTSQDSGIDERGGKPKRKGISGFLSRNIFSRKSSKDATVEAEETTQQNTLGWKLFGRVPLKQVPTKDPQVILSEYQAKQREISAVEQNRSKKDIEVMSTTALILENRPGNLPTKDPEEAERHRQQYEAMVEAAKKKEQKEIKLKKKQQQQQRKQEDQRLAAARIWNQEILPCWDAMKGSKKARELWWLGIPTSIRGKVWKMAIGNDLNVTPELYEICVSRAEDRIKLTSESSDPYGTSETSSEPPSSKESSVELIKLDVSRTFPQLCIFQKGGPYHDLLHSLLGAYACYRPDVGYVQGMSFIAAVLLLNMDVADAFICFANLLNRPCQVAFFRIDEFLIKSYFQTYEDLFQENMPVLFSYFQKQRVNPELYLMDWILSIFSKSLPLDIACRVWDVFCRDGDEFLFRTALGLLKLFEDVLLNLDFIHLCQFLTRLPDDLTGDLLFKSIECIHMNIDKKKFTQILATNKEMRDSSS